MIRDLDYEGDAYYYYKYGDDMLEFGYFTISKYTWSKAIMQCKIHYFFGWNSNITGGVISSNQLHGQVRDVYNSWYKDLKELNHELIIKSVFSSPIKFIGEVKWQN